MARPPTNKPRLARGTTPAKRTMRYVPGTISVSIFLVFLVITRFQAPHKITLAVMFTCSFIGLGLWWIGNRSGGWTWQRLVKWSALSILASAALAFAGAASIIWYYSRDLPSIEKLSDYHPKQVTVILDDKGQRIGEIFTERRTFVPFEKIPKRVYNAFIAAEDASFWTHGGVDYMGIVRAVWNDVRGGPKQGASTITQQVVKNMVLSPEQSFKRKIQEMILARRLEKHLTKEEILTIYLNEIYFGHQRYGIQEAARFYFGKDVDQLDVGEAAMLGGLPKAPEEISPFKNPQRAKERQTYVLNREAELGFITKDEAQKFINEPIHVVKNPFPEMGGAPEWVALAKKELVASYGDGALETLGAKVKTTMDSDIQANAQKALQEGLRAYDARHKLGVPSRHVKVDKEDAMEKEIAKLAKKLPKGGPVAKETYDAIVTRVREDDHEVDVDLGDWPATMVFASDDARYNPPSADGKVKTLAERFQVGDVVAVVRSQAKPVHGDHAVRIPPGPEGAVVVIEVKTRKVRAIVGGYSNKAGDFDRATMAKRQPGSSFKPFVYATAIDSGRFTAASVVNDAPEVYNLWKPHNYEKTFEGPVRLRTALAKSINTVAIRVAADMTPAAIADYAHKMGIQSDLPNELSLSLGSGVVTPLEMVNAVTTFAAGGKYAPPRFVDSIDGKEAAATEAQQVIRPEVAFVVAEMMRSVVDEGTGVRAKALGIPVYGKTGTSSDERDAWFIGMTPDWVVGVWVGFDDDHSLGGREQGGVTAVPVFVSLVKTMKLPAKKLTPPAGVTSVTIDKTTGLLAADAAPSDSKMTEWFVKGTEPKDVAPLPGEQTTNTFVTGEYDDAGGEPGAGMGTGAGTGSNADVLEAGHAGDDDAEPRTKP
ncbi:MAG TPA: PBP1A family penicillin-binding protein [Kofleriaceae bacterium]|nr:PBP1A family penicillin-binding protein [Kofleriaceae bacterium]